MTCVSAALNTSTARSSERLSGRARAVKRHRGQGLAAPPRGSASSATPRAHRSSRQECHPRIANHARRVCGAPQSAARAEVMSVTRRFTICATSFPLREVTLALSVSRGWVAIPPTELIYLTIFVYRAPGTGPTHTSWCYPQCQVRAAVGPFVTRTTLQPSACDLAHRSDAFRTLFERRCRGARGGPC